MLQSGQGNIEVESEIGRLFKAIAFSKERNRRLFERWRSDQSQRMNFSGLTRSSSFLDSMNKGIPNLNHDTISTIEYENTLDGERRQLLQELKNLEETLNKDGELAAEELLRQYTQTLPEWLKYFLFIILLILVGLVCWVVT